VLQLGTEPLGASSEGASLLDMFDSDFRQTKMSASQINLVTRVLAHAALIYLSVVVSGWQPANLDLRYHVSQTLELRTQYRRRYCAPWCARFVWQGVWPRQSRKRSCGQWYRYCSLRACSAQSGRRWRSWSMCGQRGAWAMLERGIWLLVPRIKAI
jgi:hypothetical protein